MWRSERLVAGGREERWRPAWLRRRSEVGIDGGRETERRLVSVERVVDGGSERGVAGESVNLILWEMDRRYVLVPVMFLTKIWMACSSELDSNSGSGEERSDEVADPERILASGTECVV